jgi:hypothetical protein
VAKVRRNAGLAAAALAGAAAGALLTRARSRAAPREPAGADPRADELRRKLAEARTASAEEDEFEAAGMGAETIVEEGSRPRPQPPPPHRPSPAPPPRPAGDEFEAMRRRIHQEGRAAAEEMRRGGEPPPPD